MSVKEIEKLEDRLLEAFYKEALYLFLNAG